MKRNLVGLSILGVFVGAACSSGTGSGSGSGGMGGSAGASTQKLPVGSPCSADADCGGADFMCMTDHPGGYCIKMCGIKNADKDCPSEAICQFDGTAGECHKKCDVKGDCRTGYDCAPASTDAMNTASHAFCDMADVILDAGPG